jgi:hypothetical protein
LSIWVLSLPEMRSTAFNRLLLALAIIDSFFICPGNTFSGPNPATVNHNASAAKIYSAASSLVRLENK